MEIFEKMNTILIFFVNGRKITEANVDPFMSLLTYLREKINLPGAKNGCNEGGCGSCTVMVSRMDVNTQKITHYSLNACLAPIGTMHGLSVTTVEGIGSTKRLHPIQERLAKAHGSQCGFCSPGFVMSMYALLRNNPEPTMEEIEENLVGNLCRCTGYRPILEGFRTFSKEFIEEGCGRADCCKLSREEKDVKDSKLEKTSVLFDPKMFAPYDPSQEIIFPSELQINLEICSQNLKLCQNETFSKLFFRVGTLKELLQFKRDFPEAAIIAGNTKLGVDDMKNSKCDVAIHPANVPELTNIKMSPSFIEIGAAVPISEIENQFKKFIKEIPESKTKILVAILEMLKWFANRQIKNVASLGGNVMAGFSNTDFYPILMASGAKLFFRSLDRKREIFFYKHFNSKEKPNNSEVLLSVRIPLTTEQEFFKSCKQRRRSGVDSSVSAAIKICFESLEDLRIREISLSFGGVAPTTIMASNTMKELKGRTWDNNFLDYATALLVEELKDVSISENKTGLALSYFFKCYMSICEDLHNKFPDLVPPAKEDEGITKYYEYLPTKSTQFYQTVPLGQEKIDPVGRPIPHVSSLKQTTGEATYTDDFPRFNNELCAALVLSSRAHAKILNIDSSPAKMFGVEGFFCAKDLPDGRNLTGYVVHDEEEVFASSQVHCVGQIIGIVVAKTRDLATKCARMIKIQYEDLPNPIFTIEEALEANSVWEPQTIESGNTDEGFKNSKHILEGKVRTGGQEHFYLETNSHIAIPGDGDEMELIGSLQSPAHTQSMVAKALGLDANKVFMKVKRVGGGFGGKESRHVPIIVSAAVAAMKTKRPVRIVLSRQEDMLITGGRHPLLAKWKIGFEDDGKLNALEASYYFNAGCTLDVSQLVMVAVLFNANNVYQIDNLKLRGQCCKTNLASNTAFRSSGNPQTLFVMETIISRVAEYLHVDPRHVRERNMYGKSTYITHYGQEITNSSIIDCWNQVISSSNYEERNKAVQKFNSKNVHKKRGIGTMPLKFGIGVNFPSFHQAGALILVYLDGSVLLSHGGVEIGQGLHTKMIQIASRVLEIPIEKIYIPDTATYKVPNASPTVASLSSDLNGMAVLDACNIIKRRLESFKEKLPNGTWKDWVSEAYNERVSLSATGYYKMPNIVEYKFDGKPASPYSYFSFGAAVSEVEIDCLTGEHKVLRTDIVMDVGKSLNPAIDIGQIEGAFMQGYGLFTSEQLLYSQSGELLTNNQSSYQIPNVRSIPREFNVTLLRDSANERAVYSSKAIGEPPLLSGISIFLAIREAVKSARKEEELTIPFDAPATPERIRSACEDWITQKISFK